MLLNVGQLATCTSTDVTLAGGAANTQLPVAVWPLVALTPNTAFGSRTFDAR